MKKIAVLTPYPKKVNQTIFNYLINNNIEVESFSSFNLNYDSEIAQIKPENIIDQISEINLDDVDGLFISCTKCIIVYLSFLVLINFLIILLLFFIFISFLNKLRFLINKFIAEIIFF